LQTTVSAALTSSLYELYKNKPDNPHNYLAKYLLNYHATEVEYE